MCQVVVGMTVAFLQTQGYEVTNDIPGDLQDIMPLVEWRPGDWQALESSIVKLRDSLLRKDAGTMVTSEGEEEDGRTDGQRGRSALYDSKLNKIFRVFKVQKALSPFRKTLEEQAEDENLPDTAIPDIDEALLEKYL